MTYESAELSKLSINLFLTASLSTANSLAEIARNINADWDDIKSALKLDARIGPNSYISPGLGISGGNIERDLQNITNLATQFDCHSGVFESFKNASTYYKLWPSMVLKTIRPPILPKELICVWGLTYKKNTHSVKNSPAIANILALKDEYRIRVYDPVANLPNNLMELCDFETNFSQSLNDCSALLILTDWEMFSSNLSESLIYQLSKIDIIDPYGMLKKYVNKIGKHYRL
jgi:UDPglucose 6-dehydrogenase